MSTARRIELIHEFSRLQPRGRVEFPGGEVTLAFAELCMVARACSDAGLRASLVTNGSRLQTLDAAERIVQSGLDLITVSLDSHRADVHDYVRGVSGAFEQATHALELLLTARQRQGQGRGPRIQVIAVVFDGNVHELSEHVEFCRSLGVDRVSLQIVNHTFDNHNPTRDVFFERHFWHTPDAKRQAATALRTVVERYSADSVLDLTSADLARLDASVLRGGDEYPESQQCAAHWRNVIVESDGEVSFCFNHPEGASVRSIGNVMSQSLRDVLSGPAAAVMRQHVASCRKPCADLECHRAPTVSANATPPQRQAQLEIDWAHRDAFPVTIYQRGSRGRVLLMGGFGDNIRLLHLVRESDHVICFTMGDYQERAYDMMRRVADVFAIDPEQLSVLCNYPSQVKMAQNAGLRAFHCSTNAFINENLYRPQLIQKTFDAVINSRLVKTKRVHLARMVPNLAIIQGHRLEVAEYDDPSEIPHTYMNDGPLSPRGVARVLSASRVGLALSEAEGGCHASSEYLLCGLPVVSTPSRGGRDVWYHPDNSLLCEPTAEAVRDSVQILIQRLNRGDISPHEIRARHIAQAEEHRQRFLDVTARAFAEVQASDDPARVFEHTFSSSGILPSYLPYAQLCGALTEGPLES